MRLTGGRSGRRSFPCSRAAPRRRRARRAPSRAGSGRRRARRRRGRPSQARRRTRGRPAEGRTRRSSLRPPPAGARRAARCARSRETPCGRARSSRSRAPSSRPTRRDCRGTGGPRRPGRRRTARRAPSPGSRTRSGPAPSRRARPRRSRAPPRRAGSPARRSRPARLARARRRRCSSAARPLRRGGLELAQRRQPCQRLRLELPDALARQVELVADRLERPGLALEAEPELEDPPLALGQRVERTPNALLAERLLGLVERIRSLAVGEEIAELTFVVRADGLVQRDGRLRGAERLVDVLDRKAGRLCELVLRGLAPELDLEPARRPAELLLALDDVDGHANRAR